MKLRKKETGEIIDIKDALRDSYDYPNHYLISAEWEDYEEPKEYWGIDYSSCRKGGIEEFTYDDDNIDEFNKSIGNYFETKEEAEKAVEKLKAWQRLKDKGFRFDGWNWKTQCIDYNLDYRDITEEQIEEAEKDLDLLFSVGDICVTKIGGEE